MAFILKNYMVTVSGWGNSTFLAKNKNQARARAFDALRCANNAITFKRFLQICGPIEEIGLPDGAGQNILVSGKPAHFIKNDGGNGILFAYPDSDTPLVSHELDVTFLNARASI